MTSYDAASIIKMTCCDAASIVQLALGAGEEDPGEREAD
jgi:hypothetical protein